MSDRVEPHTSDLEEAILNEAEHSDMWITFALPGQLLSVDFTDEPPFSNDEGLIQINVSTWPQLLRSLAVYATDEQAAELTRSAAHFDREMESR